MLNGLVRGCSLNHWSLAFIVIGFDSLFVVCYHRLVSSVKVSNYRCFDHEPEGLVGIQNFNLLIGRNNSGKSALIDVVEMACQNDLSNKDGGRTEPLSLLISGSLRATDFPSPLSEPQQRLANRLVGSRVAIRIGSDGRRELDDFVSANFSVTHTAQNIVERLPGSFSIPLSGKVFKRVAAERDVGAETPDSEPTATRIAVTPDGTGVTRLIHAFLNDESLEDRLVEQTLLEKLNSIVRPDLQFSRIMTQYNRHANTWEIYLVEQAKGRIRLSQSGSGLKTIIHILCVLCLVPSYDEKGTKDYVFAIEEPENNLHPGMQRRLTQFLLDHAKSTGVPFFVTTHSNVILDQVAKDPGTGVFHVRHDGIRASVEKVRAYSEHHAVLDDLDIRASDLLQTNGVIWVEGPSDRIYLTDWISKWSGREYREGLHYQCVWYGGRLLARLNVDDEFADIDERMNLLLVNKNLVVVVDSDRSSAAAELNATKKRIREGVEDVGAQFWSTDGREIENYLPIEALRAEFGLRIRAPHGKFEKFAGFLGKVSKEAHRLFMRSKVEFAARVTAHVTRDQLATKLDLSEKLTEVCERIRRWNKMVALPTNDAVAEPD